MNFEEHEKMIAQQKWMHENATCGVAAKVAQITALVVTVIGTLGVSDYAQGWVGHHAAIFGALVAAAQVLHSLFPSIFAAPVSKS